MLLFISYAHRDFDIVAQLVEILRAGNHDPWFDHSLIVGRHWKEQLLEAITECDAFVYALTPDSVESEWCQWEFAQAVEMGKPVIPVMLADTVLPEVLSRYQYADFSKGMSPQSVARLLGGLTSLVIRILPNEAPAAPQNPRGLPAIAERAQITGKVKTISFDQAVEAYEAGDFERAVTILKQLQASGQTGRLVGKLLQEAEQEVEKKRYLRRAEIEYRPIAEMVQRLRTRQMGCEEFEVFRQQFPDYDPDNLAKICLGVAATTPVPRFSLPGPFEWVDIPAGKTTIEYDNKKAAFDVPAFKITKYPITNAQFKAFVDDPEGYDYPIWWHFSQDAREWRDQHPKPTRSPYKGDDLPRTHLAWYDAIAFCRWWSSKLATQDSGRPPKPKDLITLPTEQQWQRAAQGSDNRVFPWGNKFDPTRCNVWETEIRQPTPVTQFPKGASEYGVFDMTGNVWEWCFNEYHANGDSVNLTGSELRVIRGGSCEGFGYLVRLIDRYWLVPTGEGNLVGFRCVIAV